MPIRPDLRQYYGREWRTVIPPRILARAGNQCEDCHVPDRATVARSGGGWRHADNWYAPDGRSPWNWGRKSVRHVRIVLTVAHLNHDPADNRDENLMALCQWCHLHHDRSHHKDTRCVRKDARRPLLAGQEAA